jgi:16S rRNA (guanine966-N2)-methyltransferase
MWSKALQLLDANAGWLSVECEVIVQIHPREYWHQELKNLVECEQRKYGSTLLVFYRRPG